MSGTEATSPKPSHRAGSAPRPFLSRPIKTSSVIVGVLALVTIVAAYLLRYDSIQVHVPGMTYNNSTGYSGIINKQWFRKGGGDGGSGSGSGSSAYFASGSSNSNTDESDRDKVLLFDCAELSRIFRPNMTTVELSSYRINHLRRKAYIYDHPCYERYYEQFRRAFLLRRNAINGQHYNLHLPKTAGTSLCRTVQQHGMKTPNAACHNKPGCAAWCCCGLDRPRMTCDTLASRYGRYTFVGNENYLDHPLCLNDRLYSVTIREPVSRAISHFEHFLDFMVHNAVNGMRMKYKDAGEIHSQWFGERDDHREQARRINLLQSNYMTWSLIAGLHDDPFDYCPGTEADDLQVAMDVLGSFDFIIGIGVQNLTVACNSNILTLMGMRNATLGHELQRESGDGEHNYQHYYRRDKYAQLNDYDVLLYKYSVEMMLADCSFFDRIISEAVEREEGGLEAFYFDFAQAQAPAPRVVVNVKSGSAKGALLSGKLGRP